MKRKFSFLAAFLLGVGLAQADVLYWQIDPNLEDSESEKVEYSWARLVYGDNANVLTQPSASVTTYVMGGDSSTAAEYVYTEGADGGILLSNISSGEAKSFWVELYSDKGGWLGRTDAVSYNDLQTYVHSNTFSPADVSQSYKVFTGFSEVPEPTSGLMLLMGAGLLGLRRKRRQA